MSKSVQVGDRVTCLEPVGPYSTEAGYGSRQFTPGMTGEVIDPKTPCVTSRTCTRCGVKHQTFACVEFKWPGGEWDRVALSPCNIRTI